MSRVPEKLLLLASDFVAINLATAALLWLRFAGGKLAGAAAAWQEQGNGGTEMPFSFALQFYSYDALPLVYCCWLVLFLFSGMYRLEQPLSRLDETFAVIKVVTTGFLLLLIATFDLESGFSFTRFLLVSYWLSMVFLVAGGRFALRSLQRRLLISGVGRRQAVIVGTDERGERLLQDLNSRPVRVHEVVGFVRARSDAERPSVGDVPVLGQVADLARILRERSVQAVLIALRSNTHEEILEIVESAGEQPVSFSITPDLYDIVTGHVRTNQIYGMPLMELQPRLLAPWQEAIKRLVDVAVALVVLAGLLPVWLLTAVAIKVSSPGPVLFRQTRVGKGGRRFTIYKFRTMRNDAEAAGPRFAEVDDPRLVKGGAFLRRFRLDEIPQLWNVLKGDMSLVGPRAEQAPFVEEFSRVIPFYSLRHLMRPGCTGWAQTNTDYAADLEGTVRKLTYDLYYIKHVSPMLDLRILWASVWTVITGSGSR